MQDIYKKIIKNPTVDEVFYNYFTKYISAYLTKYIFKTKLTPNFISWIMLLCGLCAVYFLSLDNSISILISGILFVVHNILDTLDGDLARIRSQTSKMGKFIDQITHAVVNPSIFFALYFRFSEHSNYSIFFIICGFAFLADMYLKKNFEILTNNKYSFSISKSKNKTNKIFKVKFLKIINDIFFSVIGFFHILILVFFVELLISNFISTLYLILFAAVVPIKFLIRLFIMLRILSLQK
jgi:hypothetical protein